MKRPRDIDRYVSRDEALAFLAGMLVKVARADSDDLVKINIQFSRWNDKWKEADSGPLMLELRPHL